jgi:hypothetical protein
MTSFHASFCQKGLKNSRTKTLFTFLKICPVEIWLLPSLSERKKVFLQSAYLYFSLHDRKVCVLGLCALMSTPSNRPQAINGVAQQIVPAALMLFTGLRRAYASE